MNADQPNILVVDDDDRLRELLQKFLSENNFFVITATDAADARCKLAALSFDMIILDRMMPGESGLDFAADLRKTNDVPILMLTAMGELEDRIAGLEQGVDDYLAKPFEPRELLLRINSILRRAVVPETTIAPSEVTMGEAKFDIERSQLTIAGKPVKLTTVEILLLKSLLERPGTTLSREKLIEQTGADAAGRAIDVQVMRLRRKIEKNPKLPRYLQTVRGKGYVLLPD